MGGAGEQNLVLKEEGGLRRMKEDGRSRKAGPGIEGRERNEEDKGRLEDKRRWDGKEGIPSYEGRGRMKEDGRGRRTGPGMKEEGG